MEKNYKKIVFLSSVLKHKNCEAQYTKNGMICDACNDVCLLQYLLWFAEALGFSVFIDLDEKAITKIINKQKPEKIFVLNWQGTIAKIISKIKSQNDLIIHTIELKSNKKKDLSQSVSCAKGIIWEMR